MPLGSRSAVVNMEVRGKAAGMLNRKCVVLWWAELTLSHFLDLIHRGAGALVLLLPPELPKEGEQTEVGGCGLWNARLYQYMYIILG